MINVSLAFIISRKKYNKGVKKCLVQYVLHVLQKRRRGPVETNNLHVLIAIVIAIIVILVWKVITEQQFAKHSRRTIKIFQFVPLTMNILVMKIHGLL